MSPRLAPLLVVLSGVLAYANGLSGPFVFDDLNAVTASLEKAVPRSTLDGRPVARATFVANRALFGLADTRPFHVVNLGVHLACALALLALLRTRLPEGAAFSAALLWTVHPLTTAAVTYLCQRTEALVSLFYLLTLLAAAKGRPRLAVLACALGMATKEIMVTAPLAVILLDRWAGIRRPRLWAALLATWAILGAFLLSGSHTQGVREISTWAFLKAEAGVLLHYLGLVFRPQGMALDYGWTPGGPWVLQGLSILALMGLAWRFRPGLLFFLLLAPTSSFLALRDLAFDQRMYLPLAVVIVLGVLLARRLVATGTLRAALLASAAVALAAGTMRRNRDYASALSIWSDAAAKRPLNPRARLEKGVALMELRRLDEAEAELREAIRLRPQYGLAFYNLGALQAGRGDREGAVRSLEEAHRLLPGNPAVEEGLRRVREGRRGGSIPPPSPPTAPPRPPPTAPASSPSATSP